MEIIMATNNGHKIDEIRAALPGNIRIKGLKEAGIDIEIPEPHETLEENAAEKAGTIYKLTGTSCFSEDTGLEVKSLNNRPGVHSAHFSGTRSAEDNTRRLLEELEGKPDRTARFRTVICLVQEGKEHFFEGICEGTIAETPSGGKGFGYDPVFIPKGSAKTFAEMDMAEKNSFSHRAKALAGLVVFLKTMN